MTKNPVIIGADLAPGPDRCVAVAMRKGYDGRMHVLSAEELPADTLAVVDFAAVEARLLAHYGVEDGMPVPPKKSVLGYSFGPQPFLKAYCQRRERVKPTLLVRAFEGLPGLWLCEARSDEEGPRVNTADLGFPPFTTKDGALAFSGDVCAEWWRRHA